LKDVLEENVPEKYDLSQEMFEGFIEDHSANDSTIKLGFINQETQSSRVYDTAGTSPSICAGTHGYANGYIKVKSATSSGFEIAKEGDSINLQNPNSETRRGRVGDQIAQTLDTKCQQAVFIGAIRGRDPKDRNNRKKGVKLVQTLEKGSSLTSNTLTTVQKDNVLILGNKIRRLTPLECFRLMDFNSNFKWNVSDSQAYRQAGNSIPVAFLEKIISKFKF
jgi:DNA (cytosine-5)-methyltransferase 1